ncbi:MAG: AraC family transcriptional regulator [Flavobacteriaceae bacterium]
MRNQNIPEIFLNEAEPIPNLLIHDFKMTSDVVKSKVNLNLHLFSFLQSGSKQVHFSDNSVAVNPDQSVLLKKGNCLMTELLMDDQIYFCKLLFFSSQSLHDFLSKHGKLERTNTLTTDDYFTIKNDTYINTFVDSLNAIQKMKSKFASDLLQVKFEELLLYLLSLYGNSFELFLRTLVSNKEESSFKTIVETNSLSNLKLEEIAFLCNMSLSTFKRYFIKEFNESPGKWLKEKRLNRAKELLVEGLKPSEIYYDLGYNNLSNFSIAFKKQFEISPKEI